MEEKQTGPCRTQRRTSWGQLSEGTRPHGNFPDTLVAGGRGGGTSSHRLCAAGTSLTSPLVWDTESGLEPGRRGAGLAQGGGRPRASAPRPRQQGHCPTWGPRGILMNPRIQSLGLREELLHGRTRGDAAVPAGGSAAPPAARRRGCWRWMWRPGKSFTASLRRGKAIPWLPAAGDPLWGTRCAPGMDRAPDPGSSSHDLRTRCAQLSSRRPHRPKPRAGMSPSSGASRPQTGVTARPRGPLPTPGLPHRLWEGQVPTAPPSRPTLCPGDSRA